MATTGNPSLDPIEPKLGINNNNNNINNYDADDNDDYNAAGRQTTSTPQTPPTSIATWAPPDDDVSPSTPPVAPPAGEPDLDLLDQLPIRNGLIKLIILELNEKNWTNPSSNPNGNSDASGEAGGLDAGAGSGLHGGQPMARPYYGDAFYSFQAMYWPIHCALCLVICTIGIFANVTNIIVLTRPNMISAVNSILCAMAFSDLIVNISNIPYLIHELGDSSKDSHFTFNWALYILLHAHVTVTAHTISIWLTCVMATVRYFVVCRSQAGWSVAMAKRAILAVFMFVPVFCIPNYFSFAIISEKSHENTIFKVGFSQLADESKFIKTFHFSIFSCLTKLVPCVLLTFFTTVLIRKLLSARELRLRLASYGSPKGPVTTRLVIAQPKLSLPGDNLDTQRPPGSTEAIPLRAYKGPKDGSNEQNRSITLVNTNTNMNTNSKNSHIVAQNQNQKQHQDEVKIKVQSQSETELDPDIESGSLKGAHNPIQTQIERPSDEHSCITTAESLVAPTSDPSGVQRPTSSTDLGGASLGADTSFAEHQERPVSSFAALDLCGGGSSETRPPNAANPGHKGLAMSSVNMSRSNDSTGRNSLVGFSSKGLSQPIASLGGSATITGTVAKNSIRKRSSDCHGQIDPNQLRARSTGSSGANQGVQLVASQRQLTHNETTTRLLIAVMIVFLICESPAGILAALSAILGQDFFENVYQPTGNLTDLLALINSSVNFILYCLMSTQFRGTFYSVVLRCPVTNAVVTNNHNQANPKNHQHQHQQVEAHVENGRPM